MFAISDNDRRAGSRPGKVSRDVPVLFHLLDVSPRPSQSPPLPPPAQANVEEKHGPWTPPGGSPGSDERPLSGPLATSSPPATRDLSAANLRPPPGAPPAMPAAEAPASSVSAEDTDAAVAVAVHNTAQQPSPDHRPLTPPGPGASQDTATLSTQPTTENAAVVSSAPAETPRPTPRPRAQRPASEDWLASHGKFIALGFLLALGVTIYLARTRRPHGATEVAQVTSPAPLIDEPPTISVPSAAAPTNASRPPTTPMPIADKSPANLVETASATSESKVELHPPAAPPLLASAGAEAKDGRATNSSGKDNLFDFPATSRPDDRLAGRSDVAAPSSPAPPTGPAGETPTASQASAPQLSPAYPTTVAPTPAYPVTTSAPLAYPTTQASSPPVAPPGAAPPLANAYPTSPAPGSPGPAFPGPAFPGPASPGPASPGSIAVTSGYSAMPPAAAPSSVNYRSAYAPSAAAAPALAGATQNPAAPSPTTWTAAAPGSMLPTQYPPTPNTATGPRYERTGSGNY